LTTFWQLFWQLFDNLFFYFLTQCDTITHLWHHKSPSDPQMTAEGTVGAPTCFFMCIVFWRVKIIKLLPISLLCLLCRSWSPNYSVIVYPSWQSWVPWSDMTLAEWCDLRHRIPSGSVVRLKRVSTIFFLSYIRFNQNRDKNPKITKNWRKSSLKHPKM
jgi:hypothetical protein